MKMETPRAMATMAAKARDVPSTRRSRDAPVSVKKGKNTHGADCCNTPMKRCRCADLLVHTKPAVMHMSRGSKLRTYGRLSCVHSVNQLVRTKTPRPSGRMR